MKISELYDFHLSSINMELLDEVLTYNDEIKVLRNGVATKNEYYPIVEYFQPHHRMLESFEIMKKLDMPKDVELAVQRYQRHYKTYYKKLEPMIVSDLINELSSKLTSCETFQCELPVS